LEKYTPPSTAEWRRLATNPQIRASLMRVGAEAMAHAKELASSHTKSGEYENSFQLVESTLFVNGHPRAAVRLENTSGHAAALEWGSWGNRKDPRKHSRPALILTRTLRWLGERQ